MTIEEFRISDYPVSHKNTDCPMSPPGALQLRLYGECGHRIGKLTHPQIKAGPPINKTHPFSDYSTTEIDYWFYQETITGNGLLVLFNLEENHPFSGTIISKLLPIRMLLVKKFTPIRRFLVWKTHHSCHTSLI